MDFSAVAGFEQQAAIARIGKMFLVTGKAGETSAQLTLIDAAKTRTLPSYGNAHG